MEQASDFNDPNTPETQGRQEIPPRLTGISEPEEEVVNQSRSIQRPRPPIPTMGSIPPNEGHSQLSEQTPFLVDHSIEHGSSHFGTSEDASQYDVSSFRSPIAGFFSGSYNLKGDDFQGALQHNEQMEEVKLEYDGLWLQLQLFWDLLLRMQPNCITIDKNKISTAVDLMLDIATGRLLPEVRPEYQVKIGHRNVRQLRRRLQVQELHLRTDMNTCGKPPKMLCGCMVALKRPKYKTNIWTRLFGSKPNEPNRTEDRSFRIRDMAGLIRLEDFLTFVSHEFDRQLGPSGLDAEQSLVLTAMSFMDDELKEFLPKRDYRTAAELKYSWVYVLCDRGFRDAVNREVHALVTEAVAFRNKQGYYAHRVECELWTGAKGGLARMLSTPIAQGSSLKPAFWKSDSKGSGK
ncbi:hypothetical protein FZEAL_2740 [Fusarium zealandicum]|uniref:Uncharacterized protein n=1 Tax=Fusarium zealandicum TaxID=1053134 RepID=A0A8H4XMG9_9HYPO|nr:hypothetical protein FZEAL_2740 [Fusarium zealandicum]